jgi:hypothetical protein
MKTLIPLTALAALVASGTIHAQTPAFSKPSGYVTTPLLQGFNLIGLNLQTASLASGKFETVAATTLTDNDSTYAPVSGRTYVLEITSGTISGSIFEVPAANISGSTITVTTVPATNLVTLGLTTNDTYSLRIAPTLEEIFTTVPLAQGGVLVPALDAVSADNIWLPNGNGGYVLYYLRSGSPRAFRAVVGDALAPNTPIIYSDGFFVQKKTGAAASLTVTGDVKAVGTTSVITQGFNPVNLVAPVGLNLFNAGLEDDIQAGLDATAADLVWVQQSNLSYKQYFRRGNLATGSWRDAANPGAALTQQQAEAVALSGAVLIQRKGAGNTNLDLKVPTNYSNL